MEFMENFHLNQVFLERWNELLIVFLQDATSSTHCKPTLHGNIKLEEKCVDIILSDSDDDKEDVGDPKSA